MLTAAGFVRRARARTGALPGAPRRDWIYGGLLVLGALLLYARTMVRSVLGGDPGEFQIVGVVLGIPHPPGYPLWVILAHLFYRLIPLGTPLWRIDLTSPVYSALAVGGVYAIGRRLGARPWLAAGAAALLAVAPEFWGEATEPRAYALNALQVALAIGLLLRWRAAAPERRPGWLAATALVVGTFFANHATAATLVPGFALFVLGVEVQTARAAGQPAGAALRARLPAYALAAGAFTLGLTPWLLPVARYLQGGGPYYWGEPHSWGEFLRFATDQDFRPLVFGVPWSQFGARVVWGGGVLLDQFGWPGLGVGLLGWVVLARRQPLTCAMLASGWLLSFVSGIMYASATSYFYLIPGQLMWAAMLAVAAEWALAGVDRIFPPSSRAAGAEGHPGAASWRSLRPGGAIRRAARRALLPALAGLLVLVLVTSVASRYPTLDRSHDTHEQDQGDRTLRLLAPRAIVFVRWEAGSILRYYQIVEGRRRDVVLKAGNPVDWGGHMRDWLLEGRAVYVNVPPEAVRAQFRLTPAGLVYRAELLP